MLAGLGAGGSGAAATSKSPSSGATSGSKEAPVVGAGVEGHEASSKQTDGDQSEQMARSLPYEELCNILSEVRRPSKIFEQEIEEFQSLMTLT